MREERKREDPARRCEARSETVRAKDERKGFSVLPEVE